MRLRYRPAWTMVHGSLQILHQRSVTPNIQRLRPVTYAENRLVETERILQEKFVHRGSGGICFATFGNSFLPKALRIHIEPAPWQQNPLRCGQQLGDSLLSLMEGNHHRHCAGGV